MAISEQVIGGELRPEPPAIRLGRTGYGLLRSTLARFLVVGGASFVVNQALLAFLYEGAFSSLRGSSVLGLDAALLLASLLAVEVSILVRFALNDCWTFRGHSAKPFRRRLIESNLSSLGSPVISLACVNLLTPLFGVSYLITNSLGIALGLGWNWLWSRHVVWRAAADAGQ